MTYFNKMAKPNANQSRCSKLFMDNTKDAIEQQNDYFWRFSVPINDDYQNEWNIGNYIFIRVHLNDI